MCSSLGRLARCSLACRLSLDISRGIELEILPLLKLSLSGWAIVILTAMCLRCAAVSPTLSTLVRVLARKRIRTSRAVRHHTVQRSHERLRRRLSAGYILVDCHECGAESDREQHDFGRCRLMVKSREDVLFLSYEVKLWMSMYKLRIKQCSKKYIRRR